MNTVKNITLQKLLKMKDKYGFVIKPYCIIWIEGIEYFNGEKIKSIKNGKVEYTTKMTEAMRIRKEDVPTMETVLLNMGFASWTLNNGFIPTSYCPKGCLYKPY